jgi:hypothetical protein
MSKQRCAPIAPFFISDPDKKPSRHTAFSLEYHPIVGKLQHKPVIFNKKKKAESNAKAFSVSNEDNSGVSLEEKKKLHRCRSEVVWHRRVNFTRHHEHITTIKRNLKQKMSHQIKEDSRTWIPDPNSLSARPGSQQPTHCAFLNFRM